MSSGRYTLVNRLLCTWPIKEINGIKESLLSYMWGWGIGEVYLFGMSD